MDKDKEERGVEALGGIFGLFFGGLCDMAETVNKLGSRKKHNKRRHPDRPDTSSAKFADWSQDRKDLLDEAWDKYEKEHGYDD